MERERRLPNIEVSVQPLPPQGAAFRYLTAIKAISSISRKQETSRNKIISFMTFTPPDLVRG